MFDSRFVILERYPARSVRTLDDDEKKTHCIEKIIQRILLFFSILLFVNNKKKV
jgi:hypothetical protein